MKHLSISLRPGLGLALFFGFVLATLPSCGGTQLASLEAQRREEARLLSPFDTRQDIVVNDLVITITANFFERLTLKTNSLLHEETHSIEPNGGALYTYQAKTPDETARPMELRIGESLILIESRMQIRILGGRNALTFDLSGSRATLRRDGETRLLGDIDVTDGAFKGS